jgi:hypothetical protein
MRLAVVIPSYNHAAYIRRAVESCLHQTRRPDRIVVIDDGSKDNSVEILRGYAPQGVELLARENRGAHNTINQAIEMAAQDCEAISILNSDDHYAPERFARCLPLLEQNPDKSVVCTGIRVIDSADGDIDPAEPRAKWFRAVWSWAQKPGADLCEWLGLANFPATTSNVIARREILLRFPFRPYRFNHDYYFLAQAVLRDQMLVLPEPLVNYRVHASNTINTSPAPLLREMLRMHLDLLRDLAPELRADAPLRSRLARYLRSAWQNVSALHEGALLALLAQPLEKLTYDDLAALAAQPEVADWPEMREYPNKHLVNAHGGAEPLSEGSGLSDKFAALRREHLERRETERAWKEIASLQQKLGKSRLLALARIFGVRFDTGSGSPQEKLSALKSALLRSRWAKWAGVLPSQDRTAEE